MLPAARAEHPALFLVPPPAVRPDSSLVHIFAWMGQSFARGAKWFVDTDIEIASRATLRSGEMCRIRPFERSRSAAAVVG